MPEYPDGHFKAVAMDPDIQANKNRLLDLAKSSSDLSQVALKVDKFFDLYFVTKDSQAPVNSEELEPLDWSTHFNEVQRHENKKAPVNKPKPKKTQEQSLEGFKFKTTRKVSSSNDENKDDSSDDATITA